MNLDISIENYLRIEWHEMLLVLISTLVLVLLAKKFFWNSIANFVNARKVIIEQSLKEASDKEVEAQKLFDQGNEQLKEAKEQAVAIVDHAKKEAQVTSDKIVNQAKEEADRKIKKAQEEIELESEKAMTQIKNEIIDVAFLAAEKIVEKQVDKEKYEDDVNELIDKVGV